MCASVGAKARAPLMSRRLPRRSLVATSVRRDAHTPRRGATRRLEPTAAREAHVREPRRSVRKPDSTSMKLRLGAVALLCVAGCEASDTTVDPADLTMRDLLGFDPDIALHWDAGQRAAARDVLERGLDLAPKPASAGL